MNNALSARKESFVVLMTKSVDHAARGFEILSKREDAAIYFDTVRRLGLLDPSQNPRPVEVPDKPGFVRIPYWRALDFLHAVAQMAGERNDLKMAYKVLDVLQSISDASLPDGSKVDNYYTFWKFAEILGLVPLGALSDQTLALVPDWLRSKYDRTLVAKALADGVMKRLLGSDNPTDLHRACLLLGFCTEFVRAKEERGTELVTIVDEYWLRQMFTQHIKTFGTKAGAEATQVLEGRLRGVFIDRHHPYRSSLWRPAIEDHSQNRGHRGPENLFVEGLRDIVLEWTDTGDEAAEIYVATLFEDTLDVMRRIALHLIDERFERYRHLIEPTIDATLFSSPYRHELYRLLDRHFAEFSDDTKNSVIAAIKAIPLVKNTSRPVVHRAHVQRDWASAIRHKGYKLADDLFVTLDSHKGLGELSEHPDFLSYSTMRSGPGPSPFTAELIIAAAKDGTLIEKTSAFKETDVWRGPSEEGLWQMVETVVSSNPEHFVDRLGEYTIAPMPLIHSLIGGLSELFRMNDGERPTISTNRIWAALLDYFEQLLAEPLFWVEEESKTKNFLPTRSWILSKMADTLAAGTRVDKTAYPKRLLPQGWRIIQVLLDRTPYIVELDDSDIVTQVINTDRGRAIEAAVNHALRVCRLESRSKKDHSGAWTKLQPVFNKQLALAKGTNFEFSALLAQYVANFEYLSPSWLDRNFKSIFDLKQPQNFQSAIAGLVFSSLTSRVYALLVRHNVIAAVLDAKPRREQETHRIVEFMCLALMWGDDDLQSSRFAKLFEGGREDELTAATDWLMTLHDGKITERQKRTILAFWAKALQWSNARDRASERLLSRLCRLAVYLDTLDENAIKLLEPVAQYAGSDFNFDSLVQQITRLAPSNPERAAQLVGLMISRSKPNYDMDDHFKILLRFLAANGQRDAALEYINKLTNQLPGMIEFYREVSM